ncbi:Oxidoreductase [Spiromyces aspiralis]|uniref:Oxidoreductase n=1 Tax=Spiromyces aspiralis TaxID=68401 RepID=A0ACC1HUJ8_9FUNG|nr:Oxidoreductase [Spiromyces aspiralis]
MSSTASASRSESSAARASQSHEEQQPTHTVPATEGISSSPEDTSSASKEEERVSEAFDPKTGEINWDCPCLGGMAYGTCGEEFKAAFSCFVYSEAEPKGMDCVEKFKAMQDCFRAHPEEYTDELQIDDEEDDGEGEEDKGNNGTREQADGYDTEEEGFVEERTSSSSARWEDLLKDIFVDLFGALLAGGKAFGLGGVTVGGATVVESVVVDDGGESERDLGKIDGEETDSASVAFRLAASSNARRSTSDEIGGGEYGDGWGRAEHGGSVLLPPPSRLRSITSCELSLSGVEQQGMVVTDSESLASEGSDSVEEDAVKREAGVSSLN